MEAVKASVLLKPWVCTVNSTNLDIYPFMGSP